MMKLVKFSWLNINLGMSACAPYIDYMTLFLFSENFKCNECIFSFTSHNIIFGANHVISYCEN